jgi:hypothetical protein
MYVASSMKDNVNGETNYSLYLNWEERKKSVITYFLWLIKESLKLSSKKEKEKLSTRWINEEILQNIIVGFEETSRSFQILGEEKAIQKDITLDTRKGASRDDQNLLAEDIRRERIFRMIIANERKGKLTKAAIKIITLLGT